MADQSKTPTRVVAISRNQFFIRDNFDDIKWPRVCCICGATTEHTIDRWVQGEIPGYGWLRVGIKDIPYCDACYAKLNRVSQVRWLPGISTVALAVIGIAILMTPATGAGYSVLVTTGIDFLAFLYVNGQATQAENKPSISLSKDKPGGVVIQISNQTCADLFAGLNNATELEPHTREPRPT